MNIDYHDYINSLHYKYFLTSFEFDHYCEMYTSYLTLFTESNSTTKDLIGNYISRSSINAHIYGFDYIPYTFKEFHILLYKGDLQLKRFGYMS